MESVDVIREEERKFLVYSVDCKQALDEEFIVYQWFPNFGQYCGRELKLSIEFRHLTFSFAAIDKLRISDILCEKRITPLALCDEVLQSLVGQPFVAKRRSVVGDCFLDHYLRSNAAAEYMAEIENAAPHAVLESLGVVLGQDVSSLCQYQNVNMAVPFSAADRDALAWLLRLVPGR